MFRAGIYCRVSVEETDKEGEYSNSIDSQIKMAEEYVSEQQNVVVAEKYIDDGLSGSNFDRPEFRRMLADIELGKIDMIIVKDISRLGREHIDTNYYLGRYFPEKGVRVLSLLDHYDSQVHTYDEMMDIKILMNDMYLRDTSKKIRAVVRMKRSRGEYTPKEPPYGYVKSKNIRNHLVLDPYAAEVVKRIFHMYLDGQGCTVIARILNEEGILCPSKYKKEILKTGYPFTTGRGLWTAISINGILKNPVYTGAIVLKKIEKPSYKLDYKREIPLSERELCENAHEAIITPEQFEQVQKIREGKIKPDFTNTGVTHKYSGLLFCGKCGYSMRKRYLGSRNQYVGYMCGSHQEVGRHYCERNDISFEKLDDLVAFAINEQMKKVKSELKGLEKEIAVKKSTSVGRAEKIRTKVERNREYCKRAYEQFMDEVLTKEEYLELKDMYDTENQRLQKELKKFEQAEARKQAAIKEAKQWIHFFSGKRITSKQIDRELLVELIERIEVYPDGQIDIRFRFCDPAEKMREEEM